MHACTHSNLAVLNLSAKTKPSDTLRFPWTEVTIYYYLHSKLLRLHLWFGIWNGRSKSYNLEWRKHVAKDD